MGSCGETCERYRLSKNASCLKWVPENQRKQIEQRKKEVDQLLAEQAEAEKLRAAAAAAAEKS